MNRISLTSTRSFGLPASSLSKMRSLGADKPGVESFGSVPLAAGQQMLLIGRLGQEDIDIDGAVAKKRLELDHRKPLDRVDPTGCLRGRHCVAKVLNVLIHPRQLGGGAAR